MMRTGLLVSVRDVDEAEAALQGGATLIDVKEPAHGSLGKAELNTIASVVRRVAGRAPVSVAMGELIEESFDVPPGVQFAKWGLAKCAGNLRWRDQLSRLRRLHPQSQIVTVGYADWQCAQSPPIDEVRDFACEQGGVFLIDTCCKEPTGFRAKPTLLDWVDEPWIRDTIAKCRAANVRLALAGSLSAELIRQLAPLAPDWFAVRGAACEGNDRGATVKAERVAQLRALLAG
jgi:uncharacterized protein (UPF0264 family)